MSVDEKSGIDQPQLSFLISGIAWQDGLLQAYRNYMVVTQSIFLASNVGLFIAQTSFTDIHRKIIFIVPFFATVLLGVATLTQLSGAIRERARSVDWWQRRLLKEEAKNSVRRDFTSFRVAKEHRFRSPELQAHMLSDEELSTLLRTEEPRARKAFEVFVPGFYLVWTLLSISSAVDITRSWF